PEVALFDGADASQLGQSDPNIARARSYLTTVIPREIVGAVSSRGFLVHTREDDNGQKSLREALLTESSIKGAPIKVIVPVTEQYVLAYRMAVVQRQQVETERAVIGALSCLSLLALQFWSVSTHEEIMNLDIVMMDVRLSRIAWRRHYSENLSQLKFLDNQYFGFAPFTRDRLSHFPTALKLQTAVVPSSEGK
ncbi:MAG TPA: hypothetical protein PKC35_13510, partial [Leptospiraceae bacterium]|nr:hypothetical protein [Leptospiraceae bacterium]